MTVPPQDIPIVRQLLNHKRFSDVELLNHRLYEGYLVLQVSVKSQFVKTTISMEEGTYRMIVAGAPHNEPEEFVAFILDAAQLRCVFYDHDGRGSRICNAMSFVPALDFVWVRTTDRNGKTSCHDTADMIKKHRYRHLKTLLSCETFKEREWSAMNWDPFDAIVDAQADFLDLRKKPSPTSSSLASRSSGTPSARPTSARVDACTAGIYKAVNESEFEEFQVDKYNRLDKKEKNEALALIAGMVYKYDENTGKKFVNVMRKAYPEQQVPIEVFKEAAEREIPYRTIPAFLNWWAVVSQTQPSKPLALFETIETSAAEKAKNPLVDRPEVQGDAIVPKKTSTPKRPRGPDEHASTSPPNRPAKSRRAEDEKKKLEQEYNFRRLLEEDLSRARLADIDRRKKAAMDEIEAEEMEERT